MLPPRMSRPPQASQPPSPTRARPHPSTPVQTFYDGGYRHCDAALLGELWNQEPNEAKTAAGQKWKPRLLEVVRAADFSALS